jgi:HD superfamily phosphohydrolase
MGEAKRLEKYEARVEFYAVEAEVVDLIKRGYGYTMIYKLFVKEGKISMSYVTFYQYISRRINKKSVSKKKNQLQEGNIENQQQVAPTEKVRLLVESGKSHNSPACSIYIEKDPEKQREEYI